MDYGNAFGIETYETGDTTIEGQPARCVSGSRVYDTTVDDLWDALTNPERLPRWFLPISGDLKAGGHYQLEGHAGGKIITCDPPQKFHATWEYGDDISWVTVSVETVSDKTRLTLEHVMLKDEKSEAHWQKYGPGATGVGWDLAFLALDYVLSHDGVAIDPDENNAWLSSDAGKAFMRKSAKRWGEAHTAAGEAPATAHAMAENTASFYTGE